MSSSSARVSPASPPPSDLVAAGREVVVLEARDRVGGRLLNVEIGGEPNELGGEWIAPYQSEMHALLAELGIELFHAYREGDHLYIDADGALHRYHGDDEILPARLRAAPTKRQSPSSTLSPPSSTPRRRGSTPRAAELDAVSFEQWLEAEVDDALARDLLRAFMAGGYMTKPADTFSLLSALATIAGAGQRREPLRAGPLPSLPRRRRLAAHPAAARRAARRPRRPRRSRARRCARHDGRRRGRCRLRARRPPARDRRGAAERRRADPLRALAARLADAPAPGDDPGRRDQAARRLRRAVLARGRARGRGVRSVRSSCARSTTTRRRPAAPACSARSSPARRPQAAERLDAGERQRLVLEGLARFFGPRGARRDRGDRARLVAGGVDARRLRGDLRHRRPLALRPRPHAGRSARCTGPAPTSPASATCTWRARSAPGGRRPAPSSPLAEPTGSLPVSSVLATENLWRAWSFQPLVIGAGLVAIAFFLHGWLRLHRRKPSLAPWTRIPLFVAGVVVTVLAIVSPIDAIGETLPAERPHAPARPDRRPRHRPHRGRRPRPAHRLPPAPRPPRAARPRRLAPPPAPVPAPARRQLRRLGGRARRRGTSPCSTRRRSTTRPGTTSCT